MKMTPERETEIRNALKRGRWGYVRAEHKHMPDMEGRVWFGTDDTAEGLYYSSWSSQAADRMEQLVARDAYARELLQEVDRLLAENIRVNRELHVFTGVLQAERARANLAESQMAMLRDAVTLDSSDWMDKDGWSERWQRTAEALAHTEASAKARDETLKADAKLHVHEDTVAKWRAIEQRLLARFDEMTALEKRLSTVEDRFTALLALGRESIEWSSRNGQGIYAKFAFAISDLSHAASELIASYEQRGAIKVLQLLEQRAEDAEKRGQAAVSQPGTERAWHEAQFLREAIESLSKAIEPR